jgi:hypothetical protein
MQAPAALMKALALMGHGDVMLSKQVNHRLEEGLLTKTVNSVLILWSSLCKKIWRFGLLPSNRAKWRWLIYSHF